MLIKVKVVPESKKERLTKESDSLYRIEIKEPAERNMANRRVRELLADTLGLDIGQVRMISGHRSPGKVFDILLDKT